jgi:transcriptional regulator with XRE-family HTH domain
MDHIDDELNEPWRQWLRKTVGEHGGPAAVARLAEVPKQTLDNYLYGRTRKPNMALLERISAACAAPMSWLDESRRASISGSTGFAEPELVPYGGKIAAVERKPPDGHGLDLVGILPGDVVEFDMGAEPREGDVVVAQVYDDETGTAATVLRIFLPPYLVVRSSDSGLQLRPVLVDAEGSKVKIMGAFSRLLRSR